MHLGIEKTKSLIREKIWFPQIDNRAKTTIETLSSLSGKENNLLPCACHSTDVTLLFETISNRKAFG